MIHYCPHGYTIDSISGIAPACQKCQIEKLEFTVRQISEMNASWIVENGKLQAEVERLRADLESEEKWAKEYFDAKEKAEAEVERLRAALEKIANDDPFVKNTWWVGTINEMRSIAAEALKGGEE